MKKLLSLLFGACGLLYGVPSQAQVMCCPANQQCGDVCCPTKGCNADRTGCAVDVCERAIFDDNGYCCSGYLEGGYCVDFCSAGYISSGYNCIECSGSGYGAYDGQCVYCPDYGMGAYDGQCVNCSDYGMGAYDGQCVDCSDYGMGAYDGQCVNCHDYGYVSDGYGYCVSPVCPAGFVPGYDSGTCCGDGYGYVITAAVFDDGNGGWSTPHLSSYSCGCPSGFYSNNGYDCLDPIGYVTLDDIYIYRNGQTIHYSLRNPDPYIGCPQMSDFSMYTLNLEWRGAVCAYLDTNTGRVGIAYAHNYDPYEHGQTVYAEIGYSIIIEDLGGCPDGYNAYESYKGSTVLRCCAPGYTYNPSSGYCEVPGYTCPSGFVSGYNPGTCCGDGYGYDSSMAIYWAEYDSAWTTPNFDPSMCGCPRSDCGFSFDGYNYCHNSGYAVIHYDGVSIRAIKPDPGHGAGNLCPDFSGYDHVWNPNTGNDVYDYKLHCCYTDGSTPYTALISHDYDDNVMDASCSDFEPYLAIYPWCCPQGYVFYESDNRCVPSSACGYIYDDVFCGNYNGGYSCMPLNDDTNFSFSEDGYTFSSSCCEATGGYAIYGYAMSYSGLYHGDICCPGGSDTSGLFFDSGSFSTGNYNNPWASPYMSDCIFHASTSAATETLVNHLNDNGIFPRYEWANYVRELRSGEHPNWRIATDPNGYGFCICDGYDAVGGSYAVSRCASACGYGY